MRTLWYRMRNVFVANPKCCQPEYCRRTCPEDYARPDVCRDCNYSWPACRQAAQTEDRDDG